jgi:hypothetical protein
VGTYTIIIRISLTVIIRVSESFISCILPLFGCKKRRSVIVLHKLKPQPTDVCVSDRRRRRDLIKVWRHQDDVIETNEGERQVAYDYVIEIAAASS